MKVDIVHNSSCQNMTEVEDESTGLVVTSPPYFSAKDYGYDLDYSFNLDSYDKYLDFLKEVFTECHRTLKKGRFIIVNTSNITINDIDSRIAKLNSQISKLPTTEKELINIQRKFCKKSLCALYCTIIKRHNRAK